MQQGNDARAQQERNVIGTFVNKGDDGSLVVGDAEDGKYYNITL